MKKILILTIITTVFLVGCSNITNENNTKEVKIGDTTVTVPNDPQKIVSDYYVGELIKLNANLVGADLTYTSSLWGNINNIENVGQSMEKVASLEPDLIITINENLVDQYSEIATTVYLPYGTYNPEELMLKLSEITNTQQEANEWIKLFNSNIDELKDVVDTSESWTILEINGEGAYYYGEHFGRSGYILYDKLGLNSTPKAENDYVRKADSYLNGSIESLSDYVGDNLLFVYPEEIDYTKHQFFNNDVYNSLEAVKNNNVYFVKADDFWFLDPFSLDMQVEILKGIFNEKK